MAAEWTNEALTSDEWAASIADRMGAGMRRRRDELGMSAQNLADLTSQLGYPVARGTIARLENGGRRGKLEVAELLVIAFALQLSPAALLWFDAPDGEVHYGPKYMTTAGQALREFTGDDEPFTEDDERPELERQRARMLSLRRLHTARLAVMRGWGKYANGTSEERQRLAALEVERAEAESEAKSHGWTVKRMFGPIRLKGPSNG